MRCCGPSTGSASGMAGPCHGLVAPQLCSQNPQQMLCGAAVPRAHPPTSHQANAHKLQVLWRKDVREPQGGAVTPVPHSEQQQSDGTRVCCCFLALCLVWCPSSALVPAPVERGGLIPASARSVSAAADSSGTPGTRPGRVWLWGEQVQQS